MIDFGEAVTYRSFELNTVTGSPASGCLLERVEMAGVTGAGYTEKRAKGDGRDAGDVYLDARRWTLYGMLYGSTRADAYDQMADLTAALCPTLAYDASSDTLGYVPLYFTRPTADTVNFPAGSFDAFINFRPLATPTFGGITRDTTGGSGALAVAWSCPMEAIDPLIYVDSLIEVDISAAQSGSGTFANRGTYPTPLTIILVSDADTAQDFDFIGLSADITISIPALTAAAHTLTYNGDRDHVLRQTYQANTTLEMGYITLNAEQTHPAVPAGGGAYSWSVDGAHNLASGSKFQYREAFI